MIKTVSQISPETDSAKRFEVIYCKFWFQKLMLHLAHAEITQSHEVIRHYAGSHTYVFGYMQVVTSTYLTLYRQSYLHFSHYVGNHTFVNNFKSSVQFLEFYLEVGKMFTLIRSQIEKAQMVYMGFESRTTGWQTQTNLLICLSSIFSKDIFTEEAVDFNSIRTQIVRVEGEHLTTTTIET